MVRLFYQAVSFNRIFCCATSLLHPLSQVHAIWPEVAAKYPNSWVLVWYLKIYLLKRVYRKRWSDKVARERAASQARQRPSHRIKNTNRSSVFQLDTGASQACGTMRTRRRAIACDRPASPSGPEFTVSRAMHRSPVIASQLGGSPSSPASTHMYSEGTRAVFRFLNSTTPSLVKLVPDFLSAGIYDQNHLEDFFTWPEKAQRNFLLKTFIGKMNSLEMGAILIALNSRRRG
ncbi:hypothetical protein BDR04DRAFT_451701 [Suillus decipiens]|nr:hypothetical protein BDR04DRAFT_451701 [Suillus decipiens]